MRWLIVFLLFTNTLLGQFTYSGYIYNANGTGAVNVPVKLYRRTNSTITGLQINKIITVTLIIVLLGLLFGLQLDKTV